MTENIPHIIIPVAFIKVYLIFNYFHLKISIFTLLIHFTESFQPYDSSFDILRVFTFFLWTYCDIYFFHILFLYFFLDLIILYSFFFSKYFFVSFIILFSTIQYCFFVSLIRSLFHSFLHIIKEN